MEKIVMRFAALAVFLILFCGLAISLSMLLGHGQPLSSHAAHLHLSDCKLPCWNGIYPGVTNYLGAANKIGFTMPGFTLASSAPPFESWRFYDSNRDDTSINIAFDHDRAKLISIRGDIVGRQMPTLRDMLTVFGSPTCAAVDEKSGSTTLGYENPSHQLILQFTAYQPLLSSTVKTILIGFSTNFACQKRAIPWRDFRRAQATFYLASAAGYA